MKRPARMIGSMIDLTERKQAEESKAHLAAIVDSSRDAIIGGDLDGTIRSWNKGAEEMYGYSVDEAIRQPISLIVPPDRHERAQRDLAAAIPG